MTRDRVHGPYFRRGRWRVVLVVDGARTDRTFSSEDAADLWVQNTRGKLGCLSSVAELATAIEPIPADGLPHGGGWFYIIALAPDLSTQRLKMGFSTDLNKRFKSYRTSNPTCRFLGAWVCTRADEREIIAELSKSCVQVGVEVFDTDTPGYVLRDAAALIAKRRGR